MNTVMSAVNIDFSRIIEWIPTFIEGTWVTIVLSLTTVIIGSLIGLVVVLMKMSNMKVLNWIANAYTNIVRGTPMLLQLFVWLYGLPVLGIRFSGIGFLGGTFGSREFITAVVALAINSGAYVSEVLRGGLESVDKGQIEAGRALGLSKGETMFSIRALPLGGFCRMLGEENGESDSRAFSGAYSSAQSMQFVLSELNMSGSWLAFSRISASFLISASLKSRPISLVSCLSSLYIF